MRIEALAAVLALATAAEAQTPPPAGGRAASPQILVYGPQGRPMALTPFPVPPALQRNALRTLIEDSPNRVVVVRHAPQPAIALPGGGALEIDSIGAFEPGYEEQRLFGVRVTLSRPDLPESERTFYLEPRDVDPLAQAIDSLERIAGASQHNATDAEFHLPEGFGVGFRTVNGRLERIVRVSRGPLQRYALPADGLVRLRSALEAARRGIFGG